MDVGDVELKGGNEQYQGEMRKAVQDSEGGKKSFYFELFLIFSRVTLSCSE